VRQCTFMEYRFHNIKQLGGLIKYHCDQIVPKMVLRYSVLLGDIAVSRYRPMATLDIHSRTLGRQGSRPTRLKY
jgi:hypothetical protein